MQRLPGGAHPVADRPVVDLGSIRGDWVCVIDSELNARGHQVDLKVQGVPECHFNRVPYLRSDDGSCIAAAHSAGGQCQPCRQSCTGCHVIKRACLEAYRGRPNAPRPQAGPLESALHTMSAQVTTSHAGGTLEIQETHLKGVISVGDVQSLPVRRADSLQCDHISHLAQAVITSAVMTTPVCEQCQDRKSHHLHVQLGAGAVVCCSAVVNEVVSIAPQDLLSLNEVPEPAVIVTKGSWSW